MKRFTTLSRQDEISDAFEYIIKNKLEQSGWQYDTTNPEVVIFIGGDGTMLMAFHQFKHLIDQVSFVGVHTGSLGFYADWKKEEVNELIDSLLKDNWETVQYPLLEMEMNSLSYLALNEITVKNTFKTFIADVYLNGKIFENFRGDGFCISTPTGSTAYNKGLNGALIHPTIECIQLTEMASINNKIYRTIGSPIVLPKHHKLELKFPYTMDDLHITCDHLKIPISESTHLSLRFQVAKQKVSFIRCRKFPFWERVRETFI